MWLSTLVEWILPLGTQTCNGAVFGTSLILVSGRLRRAFCGGAVSPCLSPLFTLDLPGVKIDEADDFRASRQLCQSPLSAWLETYALSFPLVWLGVVSQLFLDFPVPNRHAWMRQQQPSFYISLASIIFSMVTLEGLSAGQIPSAELSRLHRLSEPCLNNT